MGDIHKKGTLCENV